MTKKRVLLVSESHHLASGFGTYSKEILTRLWDTGKYELAEFAGYGDLDKCKDVPWRYYSNTPTTDQEKNVFNSNPNNSFGLWRFNHVVLDFKPDIVLTYRDPWMDMWINESPLRKYFHWLWMPTVDSYPQKRKWLDVFEQCDGILAYSEYGIRSLKKQSDFITTLDCASPGIHPEVFKPVKDKKAHKKSFGIPEDSIVVGTVMRNQKRKLFIELMKAFRIFLDNAPKDIADKTFLYLHTSYPEKVGWDIESGIVENGLSSKVFCTYICKSCEHWHISKYAGAIATCPKCANRTSFMPSVSNGLSTEDLVSVYNILDLYVQYAICEGFGMPQVEAASCGVPIASTDYSAMEDVVRHTDGYPVPVKVFFREMETWAERAYPDNDALAKIIQEFAMLNDSDRGAKSDAARKGAIKRYKWDDSAKVWEKYIDEYTQKRREHSWDSPPRYLQNTGMPKIESNSDFVKWCLSVALQRPELVYRYAYTNYCKNLDNGCYMDGHLEPFSREKMLETINAKINENNFFESIRAGKRQPEQINYVNGN
jgi:glycosyltransferase involved in cell wall biosynthesis|tara:strand:+ start:17329 stop:18945 length:1617 start_codon:yes stop_codon:yes gene_type:complete